MNTQKRDLKSPVIAETAWVAESAAVRGDVILGKDVSIWFGAVLRGDDASITVGAWSNIQDGAIVHVSEGFPCSIGKGVTIGHGAIVHGCTIYDNALIGMGSIVMDGAEIGEGAVVAAGAVVTGGMTIPPRSLAMGVPAKIKGEVSAEHQKAVQKGVVYYIERKEEYRNGRYRTSGK